MGCFIAHFQTSFGIISFSPMEKIFLIRCYTLSWWRHPMETFSALLTLCAGNSPVTGEFPAQRPVTRSFGVFFDLHLNKRLSKQSWGWSFATPLRNYDVTLMVSEIWWRHLICDTNYNAVDFTTTRKLAKCSETTPDIFTMVWLPLV